MTDPSPQHVSDWMAESPYATALGVRLLIFEGRTAAAFGFEEDVDGLPGLVDLISGWLLDSGSWLQEVDGISPLFVLDGIH